jgi:hypothetical protein
MMIRPGAAGFGKLPEVGGGKLRHEKVGVLWVDEIKILASTWEDTRYEDGQSV